MAVATKKFADLIWPDLKRVYGIEVEEEYERQRRAALLEHQMEMARHARLMQARREKEAQEAYEGLRQYPEFEGETMPADGLDPIYLAEDAILLKETQKAVMVAFDVVTDFWIPKSALHQFTTIGDGRPKGKLVVKKWFAQKAGLL